MNIFRIVDSHLCNPHFTPYTFWTFLTDFDNFLKFWPACNSHFTPIHFFGKYYPIQLTLYTYTFFWKFWPLIQISFYSLIHIFRNVDPHIQGVTNKIGKRKPLNPPYYRSLDSCNLVFHLRGVHTCGLRARHSHVQCSIDAQHWVTSLHSP